MAKIYEHAWVDTKVIPLAEANLSITSAAVLYGLSVYTVFPVVETANGFSVFRASDHEARLRNSAKIIGMDDTALYPGWLTDAARALVSANAISNTVFLRATLHLSEVLPGLHTRGVVTMATVFAYDALSLLPTTGARLKTSVWRRIPDYAIPSRAKVNGAYVNSALGRQDALDSGYDDCLFLDAYGHVCELSAANIFMVRDGVLHTPAASNDILEGISRRSLIAVAQAEGYRVEERSIDLTEVYIADEVFACGTSAQLVPIVAIDARTIGTGEPGVVTEALRKTYRAAMEGSDARFATWLTPLS